MKMMNLNGDALYKLDTDIISTHVKVYVHILPIYILPKIILSILANHLNKIM